MSLEEKLEKIDSEIQRGLKLKATDRLRNLIQEHPNELDLWNKLAELYYESGFMDAAGKYWILTEPTEERIKKCADIYEKSVNYSGYQILQELVYRGDKTKLPEYAQKKMLALEADSKKKVNYVPQFKPKTSTQKKDNSKQKQSFRDKIGLFIFYSIVALIGIIMIIGFATALQWLFES